MKILVTGNQGYIGSVLTTILREQGYQVKGLDTGYFEECILEPFDESYEHLAKDIRDVDLSDLKGIDSIVHLAGLSNDPLGELAPGLTEAINYEGTLKLADLAKKAGVGRFVYSSSQSMYGIASSDEELDEDRSEKNALTAYARTKWDAECRLKEMHDEDFTVVSFRPSTVFGASPRLRCDVVFNNLVACAYTTGKIEIKSDGTPWRPVIHVRDVCSAFIAGLEAPKERVGGRAYNVGIENGNYTVRELAEAARAAVPGSELVFTGEHGKDSRTYRVSFRRILDELKDYYQPEWNLEKGGRELVEFFDRIGFSASDFNGRRSIRLEQLKQMRNDGLLNGQMKRKI